MISKRNFAACMLALSAGTAALNRCVGSARSSGSVLGRSLVSRMTLEVDSEYPGTAVRPPSSHCTSDWHCSSTTCWHQLLALLVHQLLPICACLHNRWRACVPRASEQCPCRRPR